MFNVIQKAVVLGLLSANLASLVAAQGTQFITGACTSDADCASGCCGFNSGKCAGPIIAQQRDGGCGFGDAEPNDDAARALGFQPAGNQSASAGNANNGTTSADADAGKVSNPNNGTAAGQQFITGACTSDADCASGCCGFNTGKCAGPVIAQERDGGCGFGDAEPNDDAAQAFRGQTPVDSAASDDEDASGVEETAGTSDDVQNDDDGAGNGAGQQFITGPCTSDADCASGCCGFNTGKCAGPVVAQERDGGCGFGGEQGRTSAARRFRG